MKQPIYLDYAAATPVDDAVMAAMQPYWQDKFYNISATYQAARQVAQAIGLAREKVAHWLGCRSTEVIFTAGGTESDNLAVHGIMQQYPHGHVVVSAVEHQAVLRAAHRYNHSIVPVDKQGMVVLDALRQAITPQTTLVSIMYANNEVGTIQPLRKVADLVTSLRTERQRTGSNVPLYLHSDGSQAANYLDLHVSRLGVDMLTLNSGKIYGPKQTGALYVRAGVTLAPLVQGGGQEQGLRSGTENTPCVIGFAAALDVAQTMRDTERQRLQQLQRLFIKELQTAIPSVRLNGSQRQRLPNNVHITIPGIDNERVVMQLDEAGILCAVGSACNASKDDPSHVLQAMGVCDEDSQAAIRFTMGRSTTAAMIHHTVRTLAKLVNIGV